MVFQSFRLYLQVRWSLVRRSLVRWWTSQVRHGEIDLRLHTGETYDSRFYQTFTVQSVIAITMLFLEAISPKTGRQRV